MSQYTTGEIAKLCQVSVRTVQYYDKIGLLVPSQVSQGGRRLYSRDDVKKLMSICYLKSLGLKLEQIGNLFTDQDPNHIIQLILREQAKSLKNDLKKNRQQLDKIEKMERLLQDVGQFNMEDLSDMAFTMEAREKIKGIYATMLVFGILVDVIWIGSLIYAVKTGNWLPFGIGLPVAIIISGLLVKLYYTNAAYVCSKCGNGFKPGFKDFFFASHTPRTRKLTCPKCKTKSFCIEVYDEREQ